VYAIYPKEKIESISFLQDHKKRNFLVFTLFFIPGTPKDILTYAIGLTDMSIPLYLALTSIARMPSIIVSTISGDWISEIAIGGGGIMKVIILNAVSLLLCAVGYLIYMLINKNIALSREKLISEVWGYDFFGDARTLDTHIKLLRRSLGRYSECIVTLRGIGYRFDAKF
jgi:hypothetical protein